MTATRRAAVVAYAALLGLLASPAAAQETGSAPDRRAPRTTTRVLLFVAGGAGGLLVHEAGHVLVSTAFGARPTTHSLDYGPIPFFAIRHDPVSPRQEFAIAASGFWLQHAASEWILSTRPNVRAEPAPFRKGVLVFHLATSALYAGAALSGLGPPERDTRGMAAALGPDGIAEPVVGLLVLTPAVLDAYRYFRPQSAWARWASRGAKIAAVSLVVVAGSQRD
jgi:hypothetical protein